MASFAWRRRPTHHFGEQWVPFIDLNLRHADGGWQAFSLQIDTGAVISVLRRSAAEFLGVALTGGETVELGSIGGHPHRYYVHPLQAGIAGLAPLTLRVAIADVETVPNLLGRLDAFELLRVQFDPKEQTTHITRI